VVGLQLGPSFKSSDERLIKKSLGFLERLDIYWGKGEQ